MFHYQDSDNRVSSNPNFRKVSEWLNLFENDNDFTKQLENIYGNDIDLIKERSFIFLEALRRFESLYGPDREVVIARSPCRINLRGMHSEMQHATPNYLTHAREIAIVAGKRNDDMVVLNNVDSERFVERAFCISEEMKRGKWGNWIEYVDDSEVRKAIESNRGDWVNYVKASVLKIQDSFPDVKIKGMDAVVNGDIPQGSGMASSSAMVVSSGLACLAVNDLSMDRKEFVITMGNGEWYVGTRGGFGDHGAMVFGKRGYILHSIFLNIEEMNPEYIPFPEGYQVIIINSYKTSSKSAERLFAYNKTMFAYSMALSLIKDVLKEQGYDDQILDEIKYLGQITPEKFGLENIYRILKAVPEKITIDELKKRYGSSDIEQRINKYFGQLGRYPDYIEPRGAALWGIAESERSREFAKLIKNANVKEAGELMFIGHNGDRILSFDSSNESIEYVENRVTNDYLDRLISDLQSDDIQRIRKAQLSYQPGDFDASSPELDKIVDIASSVDGIIGASLTGAGFGGNILAIGRREDGVTAELKSALYNYYYEPQELSELDWLVNCKNLRSAFQNFDEVKSKAIEIVKRKQNNKEQMNKDDLKYVQSLQMAIRRLYKEGKIERELTFIPADYYKDGIYINKSVDRANLI